MTEEKIEELHREYIEVPSILKSDFGGYLEIRKTCSKEETLKFLKLIKKTNYKTA